MHFRHCMPGRCSSAKLMFSSAFVLILYNEYLCFTLSSWSWASIPSTKPDSGEMRILIVADPQIVGLRDEHRLLGIITRWDCDKYLRSGFQRALSHVNASTVVFLGDLLDEGSKASEAEYQSYVKRFKSIFATPPNVRTVFVSGDNDVGGESIDLKEDWKIHRFHKHFNRADVKNNSVVRVNNMDFIPMSYDMGEDISSTSALHARLKDIAKSFTAEYRVLCNHMTIINRGMKDSAAVLDLLKPSVILTAHSHKAVIYKCNDCKPLFSDRASSVKKRTSASSTKPGLKDSVWPVIWSGDVIPVIDSSVHFMNLKDPSALYEVVLPTCSYRMGVPNMGYGSAVLDSDGVLRYSVLWLPSRYPQFTSYIVFVFVAALLVILRCICRALFSYRKLKLCPIQI